MTESKLTQMESWLIAISLMGTTKTDITRGESELGNILQILEKCEHGRKNNDPTIKIVDLTRGMGITSEDIDTYFDHLDDIKANEIEAKRRQAVLDNKSINRVKAHNFGMVDIKKSYENEHMFKFTTKGGTLINCRAKYKYHYGPSDFRLEWEESINGKKRKQTAKWKTRSKLLIPPSFPEHWRVEDPWYLFCDYGGNDGIVSCAMIVVHNILTRSKKIPADVLERLPK